MKAQCSAGSMHHMGVRMMAFISSYLCIALLAVLGGASPGV